MRLCELEKYYKEFKRVDDGDDGYIICQIGNELYTVTKMGIIWKFWNGEWKVVNGHNKMSPHKQPRLAIALKLEYRLEEYVELIYRKRGEMEIEKGTKLKIKQYDFYDYQVIAFTWLGFRGQEGYVINHKDNDTTNCCLNNLEIVTYAENTQHAKVLQVLKDNRLASNSTKLRAEGITPIYLQYRKTKNIQLLYRLVSIQNFLTF